MFDLLILDRLWWIKMILPLLSLSWASDGSGSKFYHPGWVSHLCFGFWKFSLKIPNFSVFSPSGPKKSLRVESKSTQVKDWSASYLLRVKSMLGSGQGPSLSWALESMVANRVVGCWPATTLNRKPAACLKINWSKLRTSNLRASAFLFIIKWKSLFEID